MERRFGPGGARPAGLLDLAHEDVTTFSLDAVNEAVAYAAAHGGPLSRTVITP